MCLWMAQQICFHCPVHCQRFLQWQRVQFWWWPSKFCKGCFGVVCISLPWCLDCQGWWGKEPSRRSKGNSSYFFIFRLNARVFLVGHSLFKPLQPTSLQSRAPYMYWVLESWVNHSLHLPFLWLQWVIILFYKLLIYISTGWTSTNSMEGWICLMWDHCSPQGQKAV